MSTTRVNKKALLQRLLEENRIEQLGEREFQFLASRLWPVSESYLRKLVRSCGLPMDPVVEGVRQDSFEDVERTLLALAVEYLAAREAGNEDLALLCRRAVITGKEHARLAARRSGASAEEQRRKEEMASWMLLWLENPELFSSWLQLRKRAEGTPL